MKTPSQGGTQHRRGWSMGCSKVRFLMLLLMTFIRYNAGVIRRKLPIVTTANLESGYYSTTEGGTLQLTAGTYDGEMNEGGSDAAGVLIEKSITIECAAPNHVCILDGENNRRVVYVAVGSGDVAFANLKIMRGSGNFGAGIFIASSVTMTGCIISDNSGSGSSASHGGGVYVNPGAEATLLSCVLQNNFARFGGGMIVYGTATLYGCTFTSNTAGIGNDIRNEEIVALYGCAAGYYGTQGDELDTAGNPIIGGSTFSFNGCSACASGKASSTVGATSSSTCIDCLAGRYSSTPASTACADCAASKYSVAGSATCTGCLAGKSAENGGTSEESCVDCVSGRYSPANGSPCLGCAEGKWSDSVGASAESTCNNCLGGSFSDQAGSSACTSCSIGRYSTAGEAAMSPSVCQICPASSSTNVDSGSTECTDCVGENYNL